MKGVHVTERKPLTRSKIGVLMGGQSSEREVSLKTGEAVYRSLVRSGYDAVAIDVGPGLSQTLQDQAIEVAFLALHGPGGEDGAIQGFLETLGIPYTGSGVRASAIGMHKVVTKTELAAQGIPVPRGTVVWRGTAPTLNRILTSCKLKLPIVVKPASQGSTIGVTIVRQPSQWKEALKVAHRYDPEAMVEAFIPGHEVTLSLLGTADGSVAGLPAVEIVAPDGFYDFSAKYEKGRTQYLCPAPLPAAVSRDIKQLAIRTYQALGCNGAARVDFRITPKGKPYVLEINTVPGMTETSLLPMAAGKAGLSYDALTEQILQSALRRAGTGSFRAVR
ncbi:MAG: D-alanine--D-alanine ligase [Nitrospira sp.]|nr:D-alanine--D-alanine ligase [Nitrospira sp.]HMW85773.1 D-alanine--D-alanine ligase [Nitrospira sp.]HNG02208.1 D-alanine--D-alanine ligase [Nitrospira sp.]HNI18262.1 D-alanine--D-alanine ligase [Nitrospira sp.]HNK49471.1 D-alanine--D-alanine ligase [Nitrospira sp.]